MHQLATGGGYRIDEEKNKTNQVQYNYHMKRYFFEENQGGGQIHTCTSCPGPHNPLVVPLMGITVM